MKTNKKIICIFLALLFALAPCASAADELLTIDLSAATDAELLQAAERIAQEQESRMHTLLRLDRKQATLMKKDSLLLHADVRGLPGDMGEPEFKWESSDTSVAEVRSGKVSAVGAGSAQIRCSLSLPDGSVVSDECAVTVRIPVSGLKIKNKQLKLGVGEEYLPEVRVTPEAASVKALEFASSDSSVAMVDASGRITAVGSGKCTVTVRAADGSGKSAELNVRVLSLPTGTQEYSVTSRDGMDIEIRYYGRAEDLRVTGSSSCADYTCSCDEDENRLTISVVPLKAGSMTIKLSDRSEQASRTTIRLKVEHSAVYDTSAYPPLDYEQVARNAEGHFQEKTSFSGKVLQVIPVDGGAQYRISSKGGYRDVVYVFIDEENLPIRILEGDSVTVYGAVYGDVSYTSAMGARVTIPSVYAERINLK